MRLRRRSLFALSAALGVGMATPGSKTPPVPEDGGEQYEEFSTGRPTLTAALSPLAQLPPLAESQVLFETGMGGYTQTRIPALAVLPGGDVLAFCELRRTVSDSGDIDVGLRRSTDGGQTFGPFQVVLTQGPADTAGNPTVVVDPASGDVVLLTCWNRGGDDIDDIVTGVGVPRRVFVKRSADAGLTWTAARDITSQVMKPGERWFATGPGAGCVVTTGEHAGRLVMPAHFTRPPTGTQTGSEPGLQGVRLLYSDDGGLNWAMGAETAVNDTANAGELAVCVLADGATIYATARTNSVVPGNRIDTYSADAGATFTGPFRTQGTLTGPDCHGSLLTLPDGRLVFAGPSLPDSRTAMALWTSDNQGRAWWPAHRVSGLPAAYSSMAMLDPDTIGLLYEVGDYSSAYKRIELERIPLSVLKT